MENEVKLVGYINSILDPIKKTLKDANDEKSINTEWVEYPFVIGVKRGEKSVKWDNIYCISRIPVSNELKNELVEVRGSLRIDSWKDENGDFKNKWYVVVYSITDKLDELRGKAKEVFKKD
jgi:hypothetical protein